MKGLSVGDRYFVVICVDCFGFVASSDYIAKDAVYSDALMYGCDPTIRHYTFYDERTLVTNLLHDLNIPDVFHGIGYYCELYVQDDGYCGRFHSLDDVLIGVMNSNNN